MEVREPSGFALAALWKRWLLCCVAGGLLAVGLWALASESWSSAPALLVAALALGIVFWLHSEGARAGQRREELEARLAEMVRERDLLAGGNDELRRRNVELRTMHIAFADLLNLVDERTHGRMRDLVEDTGEDLASLLAGFLAEQRDRRT